MQKIGLKRDLRCINPCKSGDGSYLKKIDIPTQGGGRSGNFRGSKNQKSGKCHELSRKSIIFVFLGGGGQNFKSPVNFMNCRENRYKKSKGGRSGNCRGSKNQKSGKCHELSRKSIKFVFFTHPTPGGSGGRGGGVGGQNVQSPVNFMNCQENR